jgi:hypothetical protein
MPQITLFKMQAISMAPHANPVALAFFRWRGAFFFW